MVPVHERDDRGLVIDVVEIRMGVVRVVDNEGATETVAVLGRQVAVVPESTRLAGGSEVVEEGVAGRNGALVYERGTVGPVGAGLEETVPVLKSCQ